MVAAGPNMGFYICFITDVEPKLICQRICIRVVRVMAHTDCIDIKLFHQEKIFFNVFFGNRTAVYMIRFMAVCAAEHNLLTVNLRLLLSVFVDIHFANLTEADPLAECFYNISGIIFKFDQKKI